MMNAIESSGKNGFMEYLLPEAIISLMQGFGRLIRQESDEGLFVLGDPRVMTKPYGRLVLASLPPMTWTMDQSHALGHLRSLARIESKNEARQ